MNRQLEELSAWLATGELPGLRNDEPDLGSDDVPASPIALAFEKAADEKAGVPADWNEPVADAELTKTLTANRTMPGAFGSAVAFSKSARTEEKMVGNDRWQYSYDSRGELISAGVVSTDGGPLAKRSPEGDDVDLSKRASKPGMVNLVRTTIDGAPFMLGYDFEGANVYCRALDDDSEPMES